MGLEAIFASVGILTASATLAFAQPTFDHGEPRDDIARFEGLYHAPGAPESRKWFVAEAEAPPGVEPFPPGYMAIGAMWGDVAPWIMTTTGALTFEREALNEFDSDIAVSFSADESGAATAMTMTIGDDAPVRLERVGDLPEGW